MPESEIISPEDLSLPSLNKLSPLVDDLPVDGQIWDIQLASNLRMTFASSSAAAPKIEDGGQHYILL